jgi:hypothetical protein
MMSQFVDAPLPLGNSLFGVEMVLVIVMVMTVMYDFVLCLRGCVSNTTLLSTRLKKQHKITTIHISP